MNKTLVLGLCSFYTCDMNREGEEFLGFGCRRQDVCNGPNMVWAFD